MVTCRWYIAFTARHGLVAGLALATLTGCCGGRA